MSHIKKKGGALAVVTLEIKLQTRSLISFTGHLKSHLVTTLLLGVHIKVVRLHAFIVTEESPRHSARNDVFMMKHQALILCTMHGMAGNSEVYLRDIPANTLRCYNSVHLVL